MRVNGCVRHVFSVKGDDVAYCIAEDRGLMALVADGASITEPLEGEEEALNTGVFAAQTVARQIVEFYRCFRDEECGGGIPLENLLSYYLNSTVGPSVEHFGVLRRIAGKLKRLLGREAKVVSSSTLAAGIATARGVVVASIGDSTVSLALCPRVGEEDLGSRVNALDLISRVKYSSMMPPGAPRFVRSNLHLRRPRPTMHGLLFEARVAAGPVPYVYMGPSALAAYSTVYSGLVVLAWSDGVRLGAPLVRFNGGPGHSIDYSVLDFITGYAHNEATEALNGLLKLVEGRLDVLVDMKAYHALLLMGCLALNGLVGREGIEDTVKAVLGDGSRAGLVEVADDRSIALAYGWPPVEAGGDSSGE